MAGDKCSEWKTKNFIRRSPVNSNIPVTVEKFSLIDVSHPYSETCVEVDFHFISVHKMNSILYLVQRKLLKQKEFQLWSRFTQNPPKSLTFEDNEMNKTRSVSQKDVGIQLNEKDITTVSYLKGTVVSRERKEGGDEVVKKLKYAAVSRRPPIIPRMKSVCNKVVKEKAPLVLEERRACQLPIKKLEKEHNKKKLLTPNVKKSSGSSNKFIASIVMPQHQKKPLQVDFSGGQLRTIQKTENKSKLVNTNVLHPVNANDFKSNINIESLWQQLMKIEELENSVHQNLCMIKLTAESSPVTNTFSLSKPLPPPHSKDIVKPCQLKYSSIQENVKPRPSTTWKVAQELSNSLVSDFITDLAEELITFPEMFLEELLRKEFVP